MIKVSVYINIKQHIKVKVPTVLEEYIAVVLFIIKRKEKSYFM